MITKEQIDTLEKLGKEAIPNRPNGHFTVASIVKSLRMNDEYGLNAAIAEYQHDGDKLYSYPHVQNKTLSDNPYPTYSPLWSHWDWGWKKGKLDLETDAD